jgi:VWFA-related protein
MAKKQFSKLVVMLPVAAVVCLTVSYFLAAPLDLVSAASQETTKPVSLVVTITDKSGRYVAGLTKDQVTVLVEDTPQEIVSFEKVSVPVTIAFLLDMPALKRAELVKAAKPALLRFVTTSNPANEYLIAGLDGNSYSAKPFTRDVKSIGSECDNLATATLTRKNTLLDALSFGIDKVKGGANRKHVVVFVSNDDGNSLKRGMAELLESVKQSDVILYGIKMRDLIGSNLKSTAFDELSSTSGGKSFYPATESELNDAFDILALELAHQYSLIFQPANPTKAASKWRQLQLSVKPLQIKDKTSGKTTPVSLFARSRKGYYEHP